MCEARVQRAWETRDRYERRCLKRSHEGPGANVGSGEGAVDGVVVKKARRDGGVGCHMEAGGVMGREADVGERERKGGEEKGGGGEGEGEDGPKSTEGTEEQGGEEGVKKRFEGEEESHQERWWKLQGPRPPSDLNQTQNGGKLDEEGDVEWRRETRDALTRTIVQPVWVSEED